MTDLASDFDFDLPPALIANEPARPRDSARLLYVSDPAAAHGSTAFQDRTVSALPEFLRPGDMLIANDTEVIPAQLSARRGEARIGITLDRILPSGHWHALARNARRLKDGDVLTFDGSHTTAKVVERGNEGDVVLAFDAEGDAFDAFLQSAGALALPPYIERKQGPTEQDATDYRTIFSAHRGAVAAPTAGLHFTPDLLSAIDARGAKRRTLTLHVGAGTFLPIRGDQISSHKMHAERGIITRETADAINETKASGGRIIAVGTTTLRLLESAVDDDGVIHPYDGETSIFIRPGHKFRSIDMLMTNFHLPRSTLFMLVCAFAGYNRMRDAYAHAVQEGYRFYSYGDACLLQRAEAGA